MPSTVCLVLPCVGVDCLRARTLETQAHALGLQAFRVEGKRYGEAICFGIAQAPPSTYLATMDTDGQHTLADLAPLAQRLESGAVAMVIGSRGRSWSPRGCASQLLNLTASILAGSHVPDFGSGLRIFRRDLAQRLLPTLPAGFDFSAALTMGFLVRGYAVVWVPTPRRPRQGGQSSVRFSDGLHTLGTLWRTRHGRS